MSDILKEVKQAQEGVAKSPKVTPVETTSELDRLKLEAAQLEVELKKADLIDVRERLAEREMKRDMRMQQSRTNGSTLRQIDRNDRLRQERCNHRKGGNGAEGVVAGKGDDPTYAVLMHTFADGKKWVRCLRCAKTWKPPYQEDYETDAGYQGALAEYNRALEFPTRNVASTSIRFEWSDGGNYYRQLMKPSTLR